MGNGYYDRKMSKPCACCMNTFKWIPVIFIAAVIGWSYYAYVVQLCIFAVDSVIQKILFIFFYHIILILFLWSYWATIFTPVGTVPPNFRIPDAEIERIFRAESQETQKRLLSNFAKNLPVTNRTLNGSVRLCEKCKIVKPDRAHHCSVCGTCVLKMDHHCPWVNNCVNFSNYKFFVLFLGYALLYCLYVAFTSLDNFIQFWQGELNDSGMGRFHILFLFFVALMFAISLVSLFGYHIYLVLTNRTTLEAFRAPIFRVGGPDKNGYNLGRLANFQEVFGDDWQFWFLPIFTSRGDGVDYPVSAHQRTNLANYETMGETQTRLEHGNPTDKLIDINDATLNNHHQQQQHMLLHEHVHLEQHHHQHQDQQQQKNLQQQIQDPRYTIQDDAMAASRNYTAKISKPSSAQEPIVVINMDEHCGGDNEAAAATGKAITTIPIDIGGSSSNVQHHL